ncbi:hypothetical protein GDO78_018822, partial [Eleutherodactylus coqui]
MSFVHVLISTLSGINSSVIIGWFRLLQLCKNMKLPATKLGNLRNLAKDLQEEQHRMEKYEDTLESLNHEIEEVVRTTEKIEESTVSLKSKIETLKQQAQETSSSL